MDLVFLGPPGAGKGTQAQRAAARLGVPHISTGDLFRESLRRQTPVGLTARDYMDRGVLVPDEVVCRMVWERLDQPDAEGGVILDGFPRTTVQAEELDGRLRRSGRSLSAVVSFEVPDEILVERLSGRLTCRDCGAVFHRTGNPPRQAGVCDGCGGASLHVREDDQPEAVRTRLREYRDKTAPLLAWYGRRGTLLRLDAAGPIDSVEAELERVLEGR